MSRNDFSANDHEDSNPGGPPPAGPPGIDVERELDELEEMILSSFRLFLIGRTLVDEDRFLDRLDLVRRKLSVALEQAVETVRERALILREAEQEAREIIDEAQAKADQLLNEKEIVQRAEQEAERLRQRAQQECDAARAQAIADIDKQRRQAQQEIDEMQAKAIAECAEIQQGADEYAYGVLGNLEQKIAQLEQQAAEMRRIIDNGRQQLKPERE